MKKPASRLVTLAVAFVAILAVIGGMAVAWTSENLWLRIAGIALVAVGAALVLWCVLGARKKEELTSAKYARKSSIVTPAEREFLQTLRRISPEKYEVLPQTALLSVVDKKTETAYRNELFRIIDFVFVDKRTFAPLLLVELNDASHLRADRKLRDEKVNEICRKAKLPLVAFTPQQARDYVLVKKTVLANILKR